MISIVEQWELLARVAAAMALGGIVGMERELANRNAGFRTHMLVAGAAALLVALSPYFVMLYLVKGYEEHLQVDPIRVVEAVVAGIAFLGAGTIIRRHQDNHVEGLTTAASLLMAGGIGVTVALRLWVLAIVLTVVVLVSLRFLNRFERWFERRVKKGRNSESV